MKQLTMGKPWTRFGGVVNGDRRGKGGGVEEGGVDTGREREGKRKEDGTVCDGEIFQVQRWADCGHA